MEILFLDVGHGHATLIIDHDLAQAVLVDCPAGAEHVVTSALTAVGVSIGVGIITHFDRDHSAGVVTMFENCGFPLLVADAATALGRSDVAQFRAIIRTKKKYNYAVANPSEGTIGRIRWKRVGPSAATQMSAHLAGSRNRLSLCLLVEISPTRRRGKTRRLIISGDADLESWTELLAEASLPPCDFLLWPHHGARLGTPRNDLAARVLARVRRELVVISAGSLNSYGHPAGATVDAVTGAGVRLACTQATPQCHAAIPKRASQACAGSISVLIDPGGSTVVVPDADEHDKVIAGWDTPMCSRSAAP